MNPNMILRTRRIAWFALSLLAAGPAAASTLSGTFEQIFADTPPFDLTAFGSSDWAYWDTADNPASGSPTNEMAGASLISSLTPVGGGNLRGTTSTRRAFTDITFVNGAEPVFGAVNNPTGLFNAQLNTNGRGVSLQITLPTTDTYRVSVFVAKFAKAGVFTASLPGADNYVDSTLPAGDPAGAKASGVYKLLATPDSANDTLTITWAATGGAGNDAHVLINAAAIAIDAPADPLLIQDTEQGAADLIFGQVFSTSGETQTRVLRFKNEGASEDIEIASASFTTADFAITGLAKNGVGGQSLPLVLAPGDHLEISVKGTPAVMGIGALRTANLIVATDESSQDKIIPASATVIGLGDVLNDNAQFSLVGDTPSSARQWSARHVRVSPGLRAGSEFAVRVPGIGDSSGWNVGQANQAGGLVNGASDFESVFHFTPVAATAFEDYAGAPPGGGWQDRSFQYLLLSDDNDVRNGNTMQSAQTGNIIVNLAYLPDGAVEGGTPGFYVFNGSTWDLVIAANLAGSVDANQDGILNPAEGDTVHTYRVSIKATDFGRTGAQYEIKVSSATDGGIAGPLSSGPLSIWHAANGESSTLAAHSFTTGDRSDSNPNGGYTTPFWIDSVAVHAFIQPDPMILVEGAPFDIDLNGDIEASGTRTLIIRNEGGSNDLSISAIDLINPSFSIVSSPALPLVVAPGGMAAIDVQWDSSVAAPNNAALGTLAIDSNAANSFAGIPLSGSLYSSSNLLRNWNFEVPGANPAAAKFLFWEERPSGRTVPFGGLVEGSSQAARFIGTGTVFSNRLGIPASNFQISFPIAFFQTGAGADRRLHLHLVSATSGGSQEVNLRITPEWVFQCYDGAASTWINVPNLNFSAAPLTLSVDADENESLEDPDDIKKVYWIRIAGIGWGTSGATVGFELLDSDGTTSLGASGLQTNLFREAADARAFPLQTLSFVSDVTTPRYAVDEVLASIVIPAAGVKITGVSGGPGGFTIHYDAGGSAVNIQRSIGGLNGFVDIATGETSGIYVDPAAPEGSAFYRVYVP